MVLYSLAFVGKENELLHLFTGSAVVGEAAIRFQESVVHSNIDVVNECEKRASSLGSGGLYLGQLSTVEDFRVFGYCSNTQIKILAVMDILAEDQMATRNILESAYMVYVDAVRNPFQKINAPISSKIFENKIRVLLEKGGS
jgi:hypothetical protein